MWRRRLEIFTRVLPFLGWEIFAATTFSTTANTHKRIGDCNPLFRLSSSLLSQRFRQHQSLWTSSFLQWLSFLPHDLPHDPFPPPCQASSLGRGKSWGCPLSLQLDGRELSYPRHFFPLNPIHALNILLAEMQLFLCKDSNFIVTLQIFRKENSSEKTLVWSSRSLWSKSFWSFSFRGMCFSATI